MPAVVFVAYRLPLARISAHLEWNAALYAATPDLRIFVVTDWRDDLAFSHIDKLIYPRDLPIFSLSRTKNYGIRKALDSGCDPVLATDADIAWTPDAWAECLGVTQNQAVGPMYFMVDSFAARHEMSRNRVMADLAIGTVAMRSSGWLKVCGYNERLEGYGCDDGDLWRRIGGAGIQQYRATGVYHIAHQSGAIQQEKHTQGDKSRGTRADHWGRDDGFNPDRLRENSRITQRPWASAEWGRP
jgi:hypothetical protein